MLPYHSSFTITTKHFSLQNTAVFWFPSQSPILLYHFLIPPMPVHTDFLHSVKLLFRYDCFMSSWNNIPLTLRNHFFLPFYFLTSSCSLNHIPYVNTTGQNTRYGLRIPARFVGILGIFYNSLLIFIPGRTENLTFIEILCYGRITVSLLTQIKNGFHMNRCLRVHSNHMFIRCFFISVHGIGAQKTSLFPQYLFCGTLLFRNIPGIVLIHDILKRNQVGQLSRSSCQCIKAICNRNKPNIQKRKHMLNIMPCFQIISSEAWQIFYYNTVDPPISYLIHHLLKSTSPKIRPRLSIISKRGNQAEIRLVFNKIL